MSEKKKKFRCRKCGKQCETSEDDVEYLVCLCTDCFEGTQPSWDDLPQHDEVD